MNLDILRKFRITHSLEKFELVSCERNISGLNTHYNISVKLGDSGTNFNLPASNTESVSFIKKWANEVNLERTERSVETVENTFQEFANDKPLDDETVIWKYMDLSKFMSLLTTQSLWFSRLDKNWEIDPLEGKVPNAHWESLIERILKTKFAPQFVGNGKVQFGGAPEAGMTQIPVAEQKAGQIEMEKNLYESAIYNSYVTCWNVCSHESYHMWKLYCNNSNGIAVKSTIGRLKASLGKNKNYTVIGGLVEYLDYESQFPKRGDNRLSHVFCKSMPYSFENEFRLCLPDFGNSNAVIGDDAPYSVDVDELKDSLPTYSPGFPVELDLNTLIETVVISPHSDPWFSDLVKSIISDSCGFSKTLSELNSMIVVGSQMRR